MKYKAMLLASFLICMPIYLLLEFIGFAQEHVALAITIALVPGLVAAYFFSGKSD